jgi:hypothetical protein
MITGLFHLGVFFVKGGPWEGPISWRKPVAFGLSFGITTLTLAWLSLYMPRRRLVALSVTVLALASVIEVALVALQRWRNVPSHFNFATPFDSAVFSVMGTPVGVIVLCIVFLTITAFRSLNADSSMSLAIRGSLVILLVSQGLGGAIIQNGLAIDRPPTETNLAILGAAGVMKLPHAVTMHALQLLPALALLLSLTSYEESKRRRVVGIGLAGYLGIAGSTLLQTFSGLAPFDLTPGAALLLLGGAGLLLWAFAVLARGLIDTWFVRPRLMRPQAET